MPTVITPPPVPGKPPSRAVIICVIAAILVLPPTALVIWYASARISNASAIRELENEVRQRGEPLTLADLQAKYPPIPDEENAAVPLMKIWQLEDPAFWTAYIRDEHPMPEQREREYDSALPYLGAEAYRIPRNRPLDTNSLAAAESYLLTNASRLAEVRTALRRPRFRFPARFEFGSDSLFPHLSLLKTEAINFWIAALVASERGDRSAAIAALRDTAHVGQLLADEPIYISQLVRVACLMISVDGMEQLLSRHSLTPGDLEQLRKLLEESNLHGAAAFALVSERPFSLCVFDPESMARLVASASTDEEAESSDQSASLDRMNFRLLMATGLFSLDHRVMLETYKEGIALAQLETPESLKQFDELLDGVYKQATKFPPRIFTGMMMPSLKKVPTRFASYEARRRAALCAIAVERYRLDHQGSLPDKLDALVPDYLPEVLTDPFDGEPLRFHKLERGYVIYSVGSDREDNEGKERTSGTKENHDITFFVER